MTQTEKKSSHQKDDQTKLKDVLPRPISEERLLRLINNTTSDNGRNLK